MSHLAATVGLVTANWGLSTSTYGRQALERRRDDARAADADDALAAVIDGERR